MTKYIFVTGGVVSGLGKGITAASLGRLLKTRGLKVAAQKLDPYINVDPGTMSPLQHGEVVFQALRRMLGGVHMDMHSAALIDHRAGAAECADNFLKLLEFTVLQLGGIHFHLIDAVTDGNLLQSESARAMNAGVADKPPRLSLPVLHFPWVVGAGLVRLAGGGAEQSGCGFRCLPAGYAGHLDLTTEVLVF